MSLACESIQQNEKQDQQQVDQQTIQQKRLSTSKDSYEDEELDFEEEMETSSKSNDCFKNDNVKNENNKSPNKVLSSNNQNEDKDEGEIDSEDELEEGEVKEDDVENSDIPSKPKDHSTNEQTTFKSVNSSTSISEYASQRPERKPYYSNPYWQSNRGFNQNRYRRLDRYGNPIRTREPLLPSPSVHSFTNESAWERGLKQAKEMISLASKRKEEERLNDGEEVSPKGPEEKRQRRQSNGEWSSEDEIERRHRLAYDAAPWNDESGPHPNHPPSYYRRPNYHSSSSRQPDAYQDPWRRSKSPSSKNAGHGYGNRDNPSYRRYNEDIDPNQPVDTRYGESSLYRRNKESDSMSSLSSICSALSNRSSDRKLPYTRPQVDDEEDVTRARFDRIPKKSSVVSNQKNDDDDSFDSWSASLSSSSFSDDSDHSNDSAKEYSSKKKTLTKKTVSNQPTIKNVKSAADTKDVISTKQEQKAAQKVPIKMTFKKKQQSLKKDNVIDEQLNGESESESEKLTNKSAPNEDTRSSGEDAVSLGKTSNNSSKGSPTTSTTKPSSNTRRKDRRDELLMQLRRVEKAIEKKLIESSQK